jgi:hypothetical protein
MKTYLSSWSVWCGIVPGFAWKPTFSYFDGGSYEKRAILWLWWMIELSRSKPDKRRKHKTITIEEAERIFKKP